MLVAIMDYEYMIADERCSKFLFCGCTLIALNPTIIYILYYMSRRHWMVRKVNQPIISYYIHTHVVQVKAMGFESEHSNCLHAI